MQDFSNDRASRIFNQWPEKLRAGALVLLCTAKAERRQCVTLSRIVFGFVRNYYNTRHPEVIGGRRRPVTYTCSRTRHRYSGCTVLFRGRTLGIPDWRLPKTTASTHHANNWKKTHEWSLILQYDTNTTPRNDE